MDYFEQRNRKNTIRLREYLRELPPICAKFFIAIENSTSPLTRLGYAQDLKTFFIYLITETKSFPYAKIDELTLGDLDKVEVSDIELFLSYLNLYYNENGNQYSDKERAKARKLSAIRKFYKYLFNNDMISKNICEKITMPKLHDKEIIRLEANEVADLLDSIENGSTLTKNEKRFSSSNQLRDFTIIILFLGTGIRISELVGLNVNDFNFEENSFVVTRKGGNRTILYFSDEVSEALKKYLIFRDNRLKSCNIDPENEVAMFLSIRNNRINVRTVEVLVKKYASRTTNKKITPHKLRSTYGTSLYRETQDIYIVADVLGHSDVNTTKKHYAAISDDMRRNVAGKVILRDNKPENR